MLKKYLSYQFVVVKQGGGGAKLHVDAFVPSTKTTLYLLSKFLWNHLFSSNHRASCFIFAHRLPCLLLGTQSYMILFLLLSYQFQCLYSVVSLYIMLYIALFAWLISHQPTVLFSPNKPATSNQPAVLFSQNKPAAISHQPTEQAA
jgi:hypothetical protein